MQRVWESSLGTVIEADEEPDHYEIIVETPLTVFVDKETGEVKYGEVWVDRRTPDEFEGPIKLQEQDSVNKLFQLTRQPPTQEAP